MNELRYIFSWLLIIVGIGIGWYMGFVQSPSLKRQELKIEARYAKWIGYSYMIAGLIAIIAYRT